MEENVNSARAFAEKANEAAEENANSASTLADKAEKTKKEKKQSGKLADEIERLKSELSELNDKYLRMAAEYDNFRRRSREERDALYDTALSDTVSELLPIIDNLERAAMYDDGEKVKEGLVMTLSSVKSVFEKMGVEEFSKVGEVFDPNIHNAVLHVDDEAFSEGEIVDVFQKGYKKGKRVIRFAMVKSAN